MGGGEKGERKAIPPSKGSKINRRNKVEKKEPASHRLWKGVSKP